MSLRFDGKYLLIFVCKGFHGILSSVTSLVWRNKKKGTVERVNTDNNGYNLIRLRFNTEIYFILKFLNVINIDLAVWPWVEQTSNFAISK